MVGSKMFISLKNLVTQGKPGETKFNVLIKALSDFYSYVFAERCDNF